MKNLLSLLFIVSVIFGSCSKENVNNESGTASIELTFQVADKSSLKSTTDTSLDIASAIVSIQDEKGESVYNNEEVKVYKMGDNYISKPLSVKTGAYKLTRFYLANSSGTIIYASPLKESNLSYMVNIALPLSFSVSKDEVLKLSPEVLSTKQFSPIDFGYNTFSFKIVNPINFQIAVFEYSESVKNFILTDAKLQVTSIDSFNYQTSLLAKTNVVTVPEKNGRYTLSITKTGYNSFITSVSKDSLKLYRTKHLDITLSKIGIASSLVAFYKFNGNLLDFSGYGNNGVNYGSGVYAAGRNDTLSAISLNGSTDYAKVTNSTSLNPQTGITISAWIKPIDFVGIGNDAIVDKPFTSHITPYYQYHLGISGSYGGNVYSFGFNIAVNNAYIGVNSGANTWQPNKWYYVTGTYDGAKIKIYVNGILYNSVSAPGSISTFNTDLFIGKMGNMNSYTQSTLDEVRIYKVALTAEEILNLYQN